METAGLFVTALTPLLFKSYYVVWKHDPLFLSFYSLKGFKSYYVVWKLKRGWGRRRGKKKFKSYYVVWKQHSWKIYYKSLHSLNRTM